MALLAGLAGVLGQVPSLGAAADAAAGEAGSRQDALIGVAAGRLTAGLFLAPLLFYALAQISHLLARPFGATGSSYGARLALFWTLFIASPLMVAEGLLRAAGLGPWLGLPLFLLFLAYWSLHFAEAEGLSRGLAPFWTVFLAFSAILLIVFAV